MSIREYNGKGQSLAFDDLEEVLKGNNSQRLDQVLNRINCCIENASEDETQIESFFSIYEACKFDSM